MLLQPEDDIRTKIKQYILVSLLVLIALCLRFALDGIIDDQLPFTFFIPAGLVAAWIGGVRLGFVAVGAGLILGNLFFIHPRGSLGMFVSAAEAVHTLTYLGVCTLGIILIEKLRQSTSAFHESEERFRLMVKEAKDYAIFTLGSDGRILSWNPGAERILGYTEQEAVGRLAHMIFTADDRNAGQLEAEMQAAGAEGQAADERWHMRKDGSRFWASGRLVVLRDENGAISGYAKIMRDLTDRKRWEEELAQRIHERTAELEKRNQEMEAFTYSMAHDLRAPLRSMKSFTQILLEEHAPKLNDEGKDYVNRIRGSADRMSDLVDDLLEFARLNRLQVRLQAVSLEETLGSVLAHLGDQVHRKRAEVHIEHPLPLVKADRHILEKVCCNLISNALNFVADGVNPQVRIWASNGENVTLCVEDNGIGIAPEHHKRIFNVFERLHTGRTNRGTGMGLAIVQRGTELMGGRVLLESEPGGGSRFSLELRKA